MKVTTAIIHDTRRIKQDETYPVKIRITFARRSKLYNTIYSLSKADFKAVTGSKPRKPFKDIAIKLAAEQDRALKIAKALPEFTFEAFERKFLKKHGDTSNVFTHFLQHIAEMEQSGRIGNAVSYKCAMKSLQKFNENKKLTFSAITPAFLKRYETWMQSETEKNSVTTIGFYLRSLRAVYNHAVEIGEARQEDYPFKRGKYTIPAPESTKKALTMAEIGKLFSLDPIDTSERLYLDLWKFSYLCNGMNLKDVCLLKWQDISGDSITFRRAKTSLTNRKGKAIEAVLLPETQIILDRWGSAQDPDNYVFDFLKDRMNLKEQYKVIQNVVKQVNVYARRAAGTVGITQDVTSYTARHSFATVLRNSGTSIQFISESLGHTSTKTTANYLASFEIEAKKKAAQALTNF